MVSCFFCQNLLSDFMEGILPSFRHQELKEHLSDCKQCTTLHQNLKDTLGLIKDLPAADLSPEIHQQFLAASKTVSPWRRRSQISRWVLGLSTPVLMATCFLIVFPEYFPWKDLLLNHDDESQFVRYFPLMHGASEIVDEETSWLNDRNFQGGSLWEEGGISPDEFEKTFQPSTNRGQAP